MEERVVTATGCAAEGLIGALGREFEGVPEANGAANLELPIIEVKPRLFCGGTPAEPIASASAREKPGLGRGRELIPKLLRVNLVNGVGEPALKVAYLPQQWSTEGELVSRIVGSANGAKRRDENVESGKVIEGELCFFGWDGGEGSTLIDAALLKPVEGVSPRGC